MKKNHSFKLIDGRFEPSEALNILFALVNSKINFHAMESFGITIRSSGDTSFHEKRIKELSKTNTDIKKVLDYAKEKKLALRIDSNIEIKLIDERKNK
jgi:hypothetical protein